MKTKDWLTKYIAWIVMGLSWIFVISIKQIKPETSLKTPIIVSIIITILGLIFMYGKKLINFEHKEEIAKLSEEEIKEIARKKAHEEYRNNLKIEKPWGWATTKSINGDLIYAILVNMNLDNERFFIIINASEPRIAPTVIDYFDENGEVQKLSYIERLMNYKARNPRGEANVREVELTKDEFNRPIERVRETTYQEKKEEKEENEL